MCPIFTHQRKQSSSPSSSGEPRRKVKAMLVRSHAGQRAVWRGLSQQWLALLSVGHRAKQVSWYPAPCLCLAAGFLTTRISKSPRLELMEGMRCAWRRALHTSCLAAPSAVSSSVGSERCAAKAVCALRRHLVQEC